MADVPPTEVDEATEAGTPSAPAPETIAGDEPPRGSLGRPPEVPGRSEIRARTFARLFGGTPPQGAPGLDAAGAERIGRFVVVERLGGGAMGVVYRAHDPELARDVALKLLRPDLRTEGNASRGPARLLREAQAIARINHPNVIAVHEVGTVGDQVFIAMEFVEGQTLSRWLAGRPSARRVLEVFLAAGRGIAAAHAAGVVHRDFKPDNVLVGNDARVRVVDFGLARHTTSGVAGADHPPDPPALDVTADTPIAASLTKTGAVMGTPAYMSPEQYLGRPADARSDQFSFCVALYEGLYGQRPFTARTIPELAFAVTHGEVHGPPNDLGVPRFVWPALHRGLSVRPDDRFATMDDLLRALDRDPGRTARRAGAVVAVALAASVITYAATRDQLAPCSAERDRLGGVWDPGRREAVRAAILATQAPFAPRTWESTARLLDGYADAWVERAVQTCASERIDPAIATEPRHRCLDARLAELGGLVELLASADAGMALQAVDAAARLSDLGGCDDASRLVAWNQTSDTEREKRVSEARKQLGRGNAAIMVGHYGDAVASADAVLAEGHSVDDTALAAAALLLRGQAEERMGQMELAEATLRDAVSRATKADDHVTRAQALTSLVYVVGQRPGNYAAALALGAEAGAVLGVIGADPLLRAQLDGALGIAARQAERFDDALRHQQAALHSLTELHGDDYPAALRAHANLGNTLRAMSREAEAESHLRRAAEGLAEILGEDHPLVAVTASNWALAIGRSGRWSEAIEILRRSLATRERNDPDHPALALAHFNLAHALYSARQYDEAAVHYAEALALRSRSTSDADVLVPFWEGLGRADARIGRFAGARDVLTRALAARDRGAATRGRAHTRLVLAQVTLPVDLPRAVELTAAAQADLAGLAPGEEDETRALVQEIDPWLALLTSVQRLTAQR